MAVAGVNRPFKIVAAESRFTVRDEPVLGKFLLQEVLAGAGIESHTVVDPEIHVYGVVRMLVDCLKCRDKIGLDVAVEGLHFARSLGRMTNQEIRCYTKRLPQERVMGPYLEAVP